MNRSLSFKQHRIRYANSYLLATGISLSTDTDDAYPLGAKNAIYDEMPRAEAKLVEESPDVKISPSMLALAWLELRKENILGIMEIHAMITKQQTAATA